jgi:hypothetical protein
MLRTARVLHRVLSASSERIGWQALCYYESNSTRRVADSDAIDSGIGLHFVDIAVAQTRARRSTSRCTGPK